VVGIVRSGRKTSNGLRKPNPVECHSITLLIRLHLLIYHLIQRLDVLVAKGGNYGLIDRLLQDAEKWTQFRTTLRDQVDGARKFRRAYSDLKYEDNADDKDKALDDLEKIIDVFAKNVSNRITQLDAESQSLIQIVSTNNHDALT
jgi:hypothetical protein